MTKHAIIAGAGIGGLTAALSLARNGWQITLCEQALNIEPVGAGLQVSPNGVKLLERLGVMHHLEGKLFEPQAIEMRIGASGKRLVQLPLAEQAVGRWGARYIHIHRADLVNALCAVLVQAGGFEIQTGRRVRGYRLEGDQVAVRFGTNEELSADLLIGADGLHSTIRTQMLGPDKPRFTGNVAWRALVPKSALGKHTPPPSACIWTGAGKHAVTTYVHGGATVNFVGIIEQIDWHEEGWSLSGSRDEAKLNFGDMNATIATIIDKADSFNRWALFDRAPLPRWSEGLVVLLGDAAHPMLPSLAQGAVQAIEDAWVLADELSKPNGVAQAVQHYFDRRIARTSHVQKQAAANTSLFHHRSLYAQVAIYGPMALASAAAPSFIQSRYDWLFGETFN
ncbi:MAG: FAD-dependent monooxygenase [Rhizobiaceae bacterium]